MKRKTTSTKLSTGAINLDAIKAMRKGGREAEMEILGPGFHSKNHAHASKKTYTRKLKHKGL